MSGGGIEAVLASLNVGGWRVRPDHGCDGSEESCLINCPVPAQEEVGRDEVAAAVLAWLDARLTEGDVVEAVADASARADSWDGVPDEDREWWTRLSTAALSAVRGVLGGEGSC